MCLPEHAPDQKASLFVGVMRLFLHFHARTIDSRLTHISLLRKQHVPGFDR